ncbi:MAG: hypothetical protein DRJ56_05810 [Thermoprotei archaeon]|nr:MAG: hypothetical protein DRJ56_05810 [Thermoprotei archaeon]
MRRTVLMSIKPTFARQILGGVKRYELRRKVFPLLEGDRVVLYESRPVMAITGEFVAGRVAEMRPEDVIKLIREDALEGCGELDVPYVVGRRPVLIIEVREPRRYVRPVTLAELRAALGGFRPPASYVLVRDPRLLSLIEERAGEAR